MSSKNLSLNPDQLFQRAVTSHQAGRFQEAARDYQALLEHFPRQVEVLSAYGTLCLQQGDSAQGVQLLQQSLAIRPQQPQALFNLALELHKLNQMDEALLQYDRVASLVPNEPDVYLNRGNALRDMGRFDEAVSSYDKAIALNATLASAYWNKALLKIQMGDYRTGWQLYEWGWQAGERGMPRSFNRPRWLGKEPLAGKTLLIHAEQGLGDTMQFCRYAPMAAALGAQVVLEVPAALVALLSTMDSRITVVEKGKPLPDFDYYSPMMSLPLAFNTTVETIPASVPYFSVPQEKRLEWRQKLGAKTRLRVGVVWSGSMKNKIDLPIRSRRYVPLAALAPLLQMPVEFHVLQKEFRPEDTAVLPQFPNLQLHADALRDFSDTAALVSEMDVVLSVCTSVAHLSGALGQPTWLMLPYAADYRWMLEREDSPWYPSARLFRQSVPGIWDDVIERIKTHLGMLL